MCTHTGRTHGPSTDIKRSKKTDSNESGGASGEFGGEVYGGGAGSRESGVVFGEIIVSCALTFFTEPMFEGRGGEHVSYPFWS